MAIVIEGNRKITNTPIYTPWDLGYWMVLVPYFQTVPGELAIVKWPKFWQAPSGTGTVYAPGTWNSDPQQRANPLCFARADLRSKEEWLNDLDWIWLDGFGQFWTPPTRKFPAWSTWVRPEKHAFAIQLAGGAGARTILAQFGFVLSHLCPSQNDQHVFRGVLSCLTKRLGLVSSAEKVLHQSPFIIVSIYNNYKVPYFIINYSYIYMALFMQLKLFNFQVPRSFELESPVFCLSQLQDVVQSSSWTTNLGSLAVQWLTIAIYCHLLPSIAIAKNKNCTAEWGINFPSGWKMRSSGKHLQALTPEATLMIGLINIDKSADFHSYLT